MLYQATVADKITGKFAEKYIELLKNGVSSSDILVLCNTPFKKNQFVNLVQNNNEIKFFEKFNIYTFAGLCYNTLKDNFALLNPFLKSKQDFLSPNLCSLEVSEYIFKKCIDEGYFKDYNSKRNLLHQLFKRYNLIVQNNLTEDELKQKTKLLQESFSDDAKTVIKIFEHKTNEYCSFDNIRQIKLFQFLYTKYNLFSNIKYLFMEEADEFSPVVFDFVKSIAPNLQDYFISYDNYGSSRCGYLCATTNTKEVLENIFKTKTINFSQPVTKKISVFEQTKKIALHYTCCSKYIEMLDKSFEKIKELLENNVSPDEISIISPDINSMFRFYIKNRLKNEGIEYKFLSGTEKLAENNFIKNIFMILKLKYFKNFLAVEEFEIKNFLYFVLKLSLADCKKITDNWKKTNLIDENCCENENFKQIAKFVNDKKNCPELLSEKIIDVAEAILFVSNDYDKKSLSKYSFLAKEISDFENCFFDEKNDIEFQMKIIKQTENSIFAENPVNEEISEKTSKNSIICGTPQKIIDFNVCTKYQIWLDVTSENWKKQDLGVLYNSWVMQKSWGNKSFDCETNLLMTEEKCFRMLRKLLLLSENVTTFSCVFDYLGNENPEGITNFFNTTLSEKNENKKKFVPRKDQMEVMNYKSGKLAVAAVPGAGKTTVLQAVIEKLLSENVAPENIFVLTYMDSAATNFKERIKTTLKNTVTIPNISTIHGLALRIIKENGNYTKVGLDENFEIIDETTRTRLINLIFAKFNINQDYYEKYEKSLSVCKLNMLSDKKIKTNDVSVKNFIKFVDFYNKNLIANNKIDYDDMLRYALYILENNKDVLNYYQNICHYVIEDEAQDSSEIQQKLLTLLSGKHKNYLRCGDINQAITGTFTNADIEGFKSFISQNKCIEMNCSQRCAKEIFTLANNLVFYCSQKPLLKNSFYPIKMKEVEGKNPKDKNCVKTILFESCEQEKSFVLREIQKIFADTPNATIGLLVRNNRQISEYQEFLQQNDIQSETFNINPAQIRVFQVVFAFLSAVTNAFDNSVQEQTFDILNPKNKNPEFWKNLKIPFVISNPDIIFDNNILKYWWDINYWQQFAYLPISELALKIGIYYFESPTEKSNVYLLCSFIKKLSERFKTNKEILDRLADIGARGGKSGIKFFEETFADEGQNPDNRIESKVQIMTIHKSKGAEFDYVFLPEMTEKAFSFGNENTKINGDNVFIETIKGLDKKYTPKNREELAKAQIEENARLLYVAITRAKRKLFVTCSEKYKVFAKIKPAKINEFCACFAQKERTKTNLEQYI